MNERCKAFLESYSGRSADDAVARLREYGERWLWAKLMLEALENHDRESTPIIFPKKRGELTAWYALAFDDPQMRELREQILAFVGPTYSDFRGRHAELNSADPLERAVGQLAGRRVFRFSSSNASNLSAQVEELLRIRSSREYRRGVQTKSVGTMVRDFSAKLNAGRVSDARKLLDTMGSQALLDAQNLKFLEIQLLAESEDWGAVLSLKMLSAVVMVHRPLEVTQNLIRAIYHVHLVGKTPEAAVREMKMLVLPKYRPLFTALGPMRHPDVLRTLMVTAAADRPQRPTLKAELLAIESDIHPELLALGQSIPDPQPIDQPETETKRAIEAGDTDRATVAARQLPSGVNRVMALLEVFAQTRMPDDAQLAIAAAEELSGQDYGEVTAKPRYSDLLSLALDAPTPKSPQELTAPPSSWTSWFLAIADSDVTPAKAAAQAAEGAIAWDISELATEPEKFETALSKILGGASSQEKLYRSFPSLMRALLAQDGFPTRGMADVYQQLLTSLIGYLFRRNPDDLESAIVLVRAVLTAGVSNASYELLLKDVRELLVEGLSTSTLPLCLDLADVLLLSPCPSELRPDRQVILREFASCAIDARREDSDVDIDAMLRLFLQNCGFEDLLSLVPAIPAPAPSDAMRGLGGTIAVYTLTEGVANRCRELLSVLCPAASILTNSEKVGSGQLRDLAKGATIFVMITWSAKHAATEFIERHRGDLPIVRPEGKGVSSVIRSLRAYAEGARP